EKQITAIQRPDGLSINFTYDEGGRLSSLIYPSPIAAGNESISYRYDAQTGKLVSLTTSEGAACAYEYDGFLPLSETCSGPFSGTVSRAFDNDFRVSQEQVNGTGVAYFNYDRDGLLIAAGDLYLSRDSGNGLLLGSSLGQVEDSWVYNEFGES